MAVSQENGTVLLEDYPGQMLHQAALYNNADLLESLLEGSEADHINSQDSQGRTPLFTAVSNKSYEVAKVLLEKKADPNIANFEQHGGLTPLHVAVLQDAANLVDLLLQHGGSLQEEDHQGLRPLKLAQERGSQASINVIKRDQGLHTACKSTDVVKAKEYAEKVCDGIKDIINYVPENQASPLCKACESGNEEMVKFLLENGSEAMVDLQTGQSPLHAACLSGNASVVTLVLQYYPELMRTPSTMDGSLPIHIAAEQGQPDVVKVLLEFPYPDKLKQKYTHDNGSYRTVVDLNAREGHRRTPLHLACANNHIKVIDMLLAYRVMLERTDPGHAGMIEQICPIDLEAEDFDKLTPLLIAVQGSQTQGFHGIAKRLLEHGANPNKLAQKVSADFVCMPLQEAEEKEDEQMIDMLLTHGAVDVSNQVLKNAISNQNNSLVSTFLKHKSHVDSEYKVSRLQMCAAYYETSGVALDGYTTVGTLFRKSAPTTPVVINWHKLGLLHADAQWFFQASLYHNSAFGLAAKHNLCLHSITRVDLSHNYLSELPLVVFQLRSLRLLNLAHNKIQVLPSSENQISVSTSNQSSEEKGKMVSSSFVKDSKHGWNCPCLERITLANNRLQSLPADLFQLSNLQKLDVSHNNLTSLPFEMWFAPSLTSLDLSHNKLRMLPNRCACNGEISTSTGPVNSQSKPESLKMNGGVGTLKRRGAQRIITNTMASPDVSSAVPDSPGSDAGRHKKICLKHDIRWIGKLRIKRSVSIDIAEGDNKELVLLELDLSHNEFDEVPMGLSCLASHLEILNMSHNRMIQMGPVESYPATLHKLDLSHNGIMGSVLFPAERDITGSAVSCFKLTSAPKRQFRSMVESPRSRISSGLLHSLAEGNGCAHRSHHKLEVLKHLILCHNKLLQLNLLTQGEPAQPSSSEDQSDPPSSTQTSQSSIGSGSDQGTSSQKTRLMFPNLSVLDISNNPLITLPQELSEMDSLSEFKLANNKLKELPPELGQLKRLWNLDMTGCPVEKDLRAVLGDKVKKTGAVLGYLKSLKDEAKVYNRMKLMFVGVQGIGKTSLLQSLRKEGKGQSKAKQPHWAARMGHEHVRDTDRRGENISTVGVDISELRLQREGKEVLFRTWDFGGQREYYATHQYFLSKRSLYLVIWKVSDGEKGVDGILHWLVNIQARAPNAPVIIVGTHVDLINNKSFPDNYLSDLKRDIIDRYIRIPEPEKAGLPHVVDLIEVSCKKKTFVRDGISDLATLIWRVAMEEKAPGNINIRLMEQRIPAAYIYLEEVVRQLAFERKSEGKDPVLNEREYRIYVIDRMNKYPTGFKDVAELHQATQFLHENGVLLHYDDVSLQNLYFLDPQWLCDMLANVVTIREINSLAKNGTMRTSDLAFLFKNTAFQAHNIQDYIIELLNKFEVALRWDEHNLLIPSLLPSESDVLYGKASQVKIPAIDCDRMSPDQASYRAPDTRSEGLRSEEPMMIYADPPPSPTPSDDSMPCFKGPDVEYSLSVISSLCRLYFMSYFPSGFWPRLITRLIGDSSLTASAEQFYEFPQTITNRFNPQQIGGSNYNPEWICWQTGIQLQYLGAVICSIQEASTDSPQTMCNYKQCELMIRQEQDTRWTKLNTDTTAVLEIGVPNQTIVISWVEDAVTDFSYSKNNIKDEQSAESTSEPRVEIVYPNPQKGAEVLAKLVEHIDTLLEDFYPDLGLRFVQNSQGMYLITRIVPCMHCLQRQVFNQAHDTNNDDWNVISEMGQAKVILRLPVSPPYTRADANPLTSSTECSTSSRLVGPIKALFNQAIQGQSFADILSRWWSPLDEGPEESSSPTLIHCHLVEQCLQLAQLNKVVFCPIHGNIGPYFMADNKGLILQAHVAPDVVFFDIGDRYLHDNDHVNRGAFLGKGSFGAVFAGTVTNKTTGNEEYVAIKMLQPVDPGEGASPTHREHYKLEMQKCSREPMKNACEAYLSARKELSILLTLDDPNIVGLVGLSLQPLCLLLQLAPEGALNEKLKEYRRAGARLSFVTLRDIIIQVARALKYLHDQMIIYRDLKSENVLVWSLCKPHEPDTSCPVDVRLADYGVSRSVLPSGTKGFAGTPPFIAPEIIQHSGEENYTVKVDCFSFGMFMYELLMLKLPFEGQDSAALGNIKGYILSGGRPAMSDRDLIYPTPMIDLMTDCWSQDPNDRPSAVEIENTASSPQFCHLRDVIPLDEMTVVKCAISYPAAVPAAEAEDEEDELEEDQDAGVVKTWLAGSDGGQSFILITTLQQQINYEARKLPVAEGEVQCMCVVRETVWCATATTILIYRCEDSQRIHSFSPSTDSSVSPSTESSVSPSTESSVSIKKMVYKSGDEQVYVLLTSGHVILCEPCVPRDSLPMVKSELPGNGKEVLDLNIFIKADGHSELWCGQPQGKISIWNVQDNSSCQTVSHGDRPLLRGFVTMIASRENDCSSLWTYMFPGTTVFRFDASSRVIADRLNTAHIIPHSELCESTVTIKKGQLASGKAQVMAMLVYQEEIYIATTWGCIIVAECQKMTPLTVFRSHQDAVVNSQMAVLPLTFPTKRTSSDDEDASITVPAAIATLGNGYQHMAEQTHSEASGPGNNKQYLLTWYACGWEKTGKGSFIVHR